MPNSAAADDVEHSHEAIDDALGFAHLLLTLSRRSGALTP